MAKQKQIEVQNQEIVRKEKELDATVRKPAEAEQHRVRTLADARQYQLEKEAQGESEAIRFKGQGEADAAKAMGLASAEVIRETGLSEADASKARGLAQAEVILKQGLSEAEATAEKAEAWKQYTQAAVIQQVIDALPEVAAAVASPLAKTDRIVVISSGGDGRGAGASRVTDDVTNIVAQVPATIEALTGVNLMDALKQLPGISGQKQHTGYSDRGVQKISGFSSIPTGKRFPFKKIRLSAYLHKKEKSGRPVSVRFFCGRGLKQCGSVRSRGDG